MEAFTDRTKISLLLVLMALSTIIDGLDATIVNVALPTIAQEFGSSIANSSWVSLTYVIALAALLLPAAMYAKNGLMKRFFIGGVALFTVSSLLCGLSPGFFWLTTFRLIQGIAAALMTASLPMMVAYLMPPDMKGRGMGILAVASGIAVVAGPSLGGMITHLLSWHWIFYVNVPVGILTIMIAMTILPKDEGYDKARNPDLLNSILTLVAIGAGITCLQNIVESDISVEVLILAAVVSIISLALLVKRSVKHPEKSLVPPSMLKRKDFVLLSVAFTMTCMIIAGTQYVLPFFLQNSWGMSVSESGLMISIASIFAIALSVPIGKWCDSRGARIPSILAGVGRLAFCIIFIIVVPKEEMWLLVIGLAVMGCSMALAGTGLATAMIHHADELHQSEATTFLLEINYVAASLGLVVAAMVFSLGSTGGGSSLISIGHIGSTDDIIHNGFDLVMIVCAAMSVVAIICAALVKNIVPKHK